MKTKLTTAAAIFSLAFGTVALADATSTTVQRDANQQERIEQGLKSGELNTKEAGKLEREETKVEHDQAKALQDGKVTAAEHAKLATEQNKVSQDIHEQKHDAQVGNPNSASSQRMQADVQRNVNQQERIEQGVKSGALTNHEAGALEKGQAHDTRVESRAAANGHVGAAEQKHIQTAENRQSKHVFNKKHNARTE